MNVTVAELAQLVGGNVLGDRARIIRAAKPLREAQSGDITFLDKSRNAPKLQGAKASAVVVPADVNVPGLTLIQAADPLTAFIAIAQRLHGRAPEPVTGVDPRAIVHPSATIAPDTNVAPLAVVGANSVIGARCRIHSSVIIGRDCRIGDDVVLHPHVVLYDGTIIGDRVIIHANSVIGADGFGYRLQDGKHAKVPQLGHVEIGADVEIGACSTVDRATFGATRIGAGSKLDNLVMVAHNVQVGSHNILCAQAGIAGSSSTGHYVVMAGQSGIADHVNVGDGAVVAAQAGVIGDVEPRRSVFGIPARDAHEQLRLQAFYRKLPDIYRDVQALKKQLNVPDQKRAG